MTTRAHTRLFGTDGIRGEAGVFPLDPATVAAIGEAIGDTLGGELIVGRDPRESGLWILERLCDGIGRAGGRVHNVGVLPTPAVALLTSQSAAAGGVMISASHNPFEDNGIKVFGADGRKLGDLEEARVEERVSELLALAEMHETRSPDEGSQTSSADRDRYLSQLRGRFSGGLWLRGLRILCDCANGATSEVAPLLFGSLGAHVEAICASPDGRNINKDCGAVHPQSLIGKMQEGRFDLGVAFDGDGDRSIFVTATGRLIDGDGVLWVMARHLLTAGALVPPEIVGTSMTNVALENRLRELGIRLHRVDVGDRFIFRKMVEGGFRLGGEPSGHVIFSDYGLSGDGLLTTLKLCQVMVDTGRSLDELTSDWSPAPQLIENLRVSQKIPLTSLPDVTAKIREIEHTLETTGRIIVRYSGTEPLLRIMIESDSDRTNRTLANDLAEVVRKSIN